VIMMLRENSSANRFKYWLGSRFDNRFLFQSSGQD
jgi:hypothetical protein